VKKSEWASEREVQCFSVKKKDEKGKGRPQSGRRREKDRMPQEAKIHEKFQVKNFSRISCRIAVQTLK